MHLVIPPFPVIAAALGVEELASTVPPAISLEAFILGADLVLFYHVLVVGEVGMLLLHLGYDGGELVDIERTCLPKLEPSGLRGHFSWGRRHFGWPWRDVVYNHILTLPGKLLRLGFDERFEA
jgi:hypothetical protein